MAEKVKPFQELQDIARQKGFGPPTYEIVVTETKSFKCFLKFFVYTIEATAPTEDQSLNLCCTNMLNFWMIPDEFKSVCTKELNVTKDYNEFHKAIGDNERKNSELEHKNFGNRTLNPVSFLYEYAAKTNEKFPEFTEVKLPNSRYYVVCKFMGRSVESECLVSKKTTKHDAALKMIDVIGLNIPPEVKLSSSDMSCSSSTSDMIQKINHVGILQDFAIKQNEAPPLYDLYSRSGPQHCQEFQIKCSYMQISGIGHGKTKREANSVIYLLVKSGSCIMPQGRRNVKKPASSKQRRVSPTADSSPMSSISQPRRGKRVQITEMSEDTGEREITEESAAVQDMDAAAEISEVALSEAEGGLDGDEGQEKGTRRVEDVVMVILADTTQKLLNCVIGEHLFVDKTWCNVPKKLVLQDLANLKEESSFFPYAKDIEAYSEGEFLIGYTPFEEVENRFLFCVTVQGKMTILDRLFNLRSSYMQRITKLKSVRPGAWQSHGSEKEVEGANVHYERPLLSFERLTRFTLRNTGQPTFSEWVAGVDKSTVVHCLPISKSLQEMNLVVRKCQDVAVQVNSINNLLSCSTTVFLLAISTFNSLLKALRYNELYDLYHDDYPTLSKMGTKFQPAPIDVYKQYQSFTDVGAIEGKLIVSVSWSTKYTGVFAVAYADEVPCKWKVIDSDSDDAEYEEETSDTNYDAKKGTKTKGEDGSGEGQFLDEEAAWKKEQQEVQDMSAYSKSQAKLQQLELARITQVFELEEYKKFMKQKEKYSDDWIQRKWQKEQNLRRGRSKSGFRSLHKIAEKKPLKEDALPIPSEDGMQPPTVNPVIEEPSIPEEMDVNQGNEESQEQQQEAGIRRSSDERRQLGTKPSRPSLKVSGIRKKIGSAKKEKKRMMKMKRRLRDEYAWKSQAQNYDYVFYRSILTENLDKKKRDFGINEVAKDLKLNTGSNLSLPRATTTSGGGSGKSSFGMYKNRSKELFNHNVQIDRMDDYAINLSSKKIRKEIFQKYKQDRRGKSIRVVVEDEEASKKEVKKKNGQSEKQSTLRETPSLTAIWGPEESWEYGMSLREAVRRLHRHHKKVRKQIHKRIRPMFTPIQWPETSLLTSQKMKEGVSETGSVPGSSGSDESCSVSQLKRDRDKMTFQSRKLVEEYEEVIDEKEMKEEAEVLPMLVPNNPVLIWSFKDDLAPKLRLDCPYELSCIQFCPQNGNILAGATASGQVVIWDITGRLEAIESSDTEHTEENKQRKRLEDLMDWTKDVRTKRRVNVTAISSSAYSHRERCTDLKWIHPCIEINNQGFGEPVSPGNFSYQFVTTSLCGTILFWDLKSAPIVKAKPKSLKPHQKIFSQLYNPFPESQFSPLNNAWKPFLKIKLPETAGSSETLTGLAVDQPPTKYALKSPQGPQFMEDRCEYGLVHTPILGYSSQIIVGTRCGDVGIIDLTGVKAGTNELEYIQKWYDLAHDGPVTGVFLHPFFPQLTITAGGHVFALWHSKFQDYPIMWRRYRKVRVTACLWSTLRPSLFRIAREDGSVEIWDLLRRSNRHQRDIIVSGQILTTIAGGPLPLPRGLLGIADYNSTMRMFYIPWQYQVWTEDEKLQMEAMIDKEPERLRRMHEWRKWFNETQVTKEKEEEQKDELSEKQESEDVETSRQEEVRRKYNDEVYKWYMKRRGKYVTKFEMQAKERLELRERAHMLNTVMTRKKVDRQRMEKLMHPLVKMERQEMEREEKAQRRLKEADALFKAAVQKLFPSSSEMDGGFESLNVEDDLVDVTLELETLFGDNSEQLQKQKVDELSQWNWEWDIFTDDFFETQRSMRELFSTNPQVLRKYKWLKQKLIKQLVEEGHPILIPKTRMENYVDWKYKHREENIDKLKAIYGPNYDVFWDRGVTCRRLQDRKQMLTGIKEDEVEADIPGEERRSSVLHFMMDVQGETDAVQERQEKSSESDGEPIKSVLEKMSAMAEDESIDELDLDEQVLLMTRQSGLLPTVASPTGLSWLSLDMQEDQGSVEFDFKPELDSTPHTFVSQQVKTVKQQKIVQQSVAIEMQTEDESDEEEEEAEEEEEEVVDEDETGPEHADSKQSGSRQMSVEELQSKAVGSSELSEGENAAIKEMFTKSDVSVEDHISSQID
ncbi:hypothetical protein LSTR_LSTR013352 [Laodelphax striatellus]|uniref:DRBM domain-containing protein n=1 Tax=Laodelphax striatellus TaxID=195883 RepID=A0A482XAP7_LAOST|nr:hypothetical protein LSTR_LSTR013352 [Laodelphax striatellus]